MEKGYIKQFDDLVANAMVTIKETLTKKGNVTFDLKTLIENGECPYDSQYINCYKDDYSNQRAAFILSEITPDTVKGIMLTGYDEMDFPFDADELENEIEELIIAELPNVSVLMLADIVNYNKGE